MQRHRRVGLEDGEELGGRERERRFRDARGEVLAQHVDVERDVASALTGVDERELVDAREVALRDRERALAVVRDGRAAAQPPSQQPEDDREQQQPADDPRPDDRRRAHHVARGPGHAPRGIGGAHALHDDGEIWNRVAAIDAARGDDEAAQGDVLRADGPGHEPIGGGALDGRGVGARLLAPRIDGLDRDAAVRAHGKADLGALRRTHAHPHEKVLADGHGVRLDARAHLHRGRPRRIARDALRRGRALQRQQRGREQRERDHRRRRMLRRRKNLSSGST